MSNVLTLDDIIPENFDDVLRDILEHKHTHYVFKGGRGSGKSSFVAIVILLILMTKGNENMNAIIFRKTGNTLRDSVYAQMQFAIGQLGIQDYFTCTVSPMKIVYNPTGQVIMFRGVDDKLKLKSLKAPKGYFAISWLEECDSFSGMEEIRSILQSAMRGGDKFWVFMSFNPPQTIANFMNKEVDVHRDDRLIHSSDYRTVPVEWLGEQFIAEAEHLRDTNYHAYEHEYLGIPNGNGGNVFEYLEIREITDEEISHMDRIIQGADWGFFPDPFAFIRTYYDSSQEKIYLIDELYKQKWSNAKSGEWILDKGYDDFEIRCDSAEPKSINDFKDMGLPARGAKKGAGSIEYGFKYLQTRTIVIDPNRTPNAYKELVEYEYERDKDGNVLSGYPDKDDHIISALRYAYEPYFNRRGTSA